MLSSTPTTPVLIPACTAEVFSHLSGLPLGVVEAQLDRRILPVLRLGKRRLVNLEALRALALSETQKSGVQA